MTAVVLARVDTRDALEALARMQINGDLDHATDQFMCDSIRAFAPALRGEQEQTNIYRWFGDLCGAIVLVDGCENGTVHWCEVLGGASGNDLDGQALDAARARLDATLDEMTGRG